MEALLSEVKRKVRYGSEGLARDHPGTQSFVPARLALIESWAYKIRSSLGRLRPLASCQHAG